MTWRRLVGQACSSTFGQSSDAAVRHCSGVDRSAAMRHCREEEQAPPQLLRGLRACQLPRHAPLTSNLPPTCSSNQADSRARALLCLCCADRQQRLTCDCSKAVAGRDGGTHGVEQLRHKLVLPPHCREAGIHKHPCSVVAAQEGQRDRQHGQARQQAPSLRQPARGRSCGVRRQAVRRRRRRRRRDGGAAQIDIPATCLYTPSATGVNWGAGSCRGADSSPTPAASSASTTVAVRIERGALAESRGGQPASGVEGR